MGLDYDALFRCADQALYVVKNNGKGHYSYYRKEAVPMDEVISAVSPIDGESAASQTR